MERPISPLLLDLLCGRPLSRVPGDDECEALLAQAQEEHVLPWAAAQLRLHTADLTPAILNRLRTIERDAAINAFSGAPS